MHRIVIGNPRHPSSIILHPSSFIPVTYNTMNNMLGGGPSSSSSTSTSTRYHHQHHTQHSSNTHYNNNATTTNSGNNTTTNNQNGHTNSIKSPRKHHHPSRSHHHSTTPSKKSTTKLYLPSKPKSPFTSPPPGPVPEIIVSLVPTQSDPFTLDPLDATTTSSTTTSSVTADFNAYTTWIHDSLLEYPSITLLGVEPALAVFVSILLLTQNQGIAVIDNNALETVTMYDERDNGPRSCLRITVSRGPVVIEEVRICCYLYRENG